MVIKLDSLTKEQFIDLSHTLVAGETTYKGLPAPIICDFLSREASRSHYTDGTEFHIGKIELIANFFAVPVKIHDFGTFPIRAFAITKHNHDDNSDSN